MASESAIKTLGQPITFPFSGKTAPNRFLKSAMTERLCTWDEENFDERGKVTKEYLEIYRQWGIGEIGTIVLGNIPVHRENLEAQGNIVLDYDNKWDAVRQLKPVVKLCKIKGNLVIGQLTHGGRQVPSHVNKHPVSASDTQCPEAMGMTFAPARALTVDEIHDLVQRWGWASEQLYKAGADGMQMHCAHGYLGSQFLSPRVNKRTDQYGGNFENRARFIMEVFAEVRKRVPDTKFMMTIKINSADFADGGFSAEECEAMCQKLEAVGVDLIELSGGTYESSGFEHKKESTVKREAFFIEFAERIRPKLKKTVLAVTGGFRSAERMAEAIEGHSCDIVGMARPLTAEPYLCRDILAGKTKGALDNLVNPAMQTPAAIIQIHDCAEKRPILDISNQKGADRAAQIMKEQPKIFSGYSATQAAHDFDD